MKNVLFAAILPLCAWVGHASCSEAQPVLHVTTPTEIIGIAFTRETPILTIKQTIYNSGAVNTNGIKAKDLRLSTPEGVVLENDHTCGQYGLGNISQLFVGKKTQAQIDAELRARAAAIHETLQDKPLPKNLVVIITRLDSHND